MLFCGREDAADFIKRRVMDLGGGFFASPDADLIFEMKGWLVFWWVISPQTQIPQIIPQIRPSAEPLPMVAAAQIIERKTDILSLCIYL